MVLDVVEAQLERAHQGAVAPRRVQHAEGVLISLDCKPASSQYGENVGYHRGVEEGRGERGEGLTVFHGKGQGPQAPLALVVVRAGDAQEQALDGGAVVDGATGDNLQGGLAYGEVVVLQQGLEGVPLQGILGVLGDVLRLGLRGPDLGLVAVVLEGEAHGADEARRGQAEADQHGALIAEEGEYSHHVGIRVRVLLDPYQIF